MTHRFVVALGSALAAALAFAGCGHDWGRFQFGDSDASSGGTTGGTGGTNTGGSGNAKGGTGGTGATLTGGTGGGLGGAGGTGGSSGCSDGAQNGDESAVDCGGSCPPCAAGKTCSTGSDCATTFCADGVCCDTACTGACISCNDAANLGKCSPVPA